MAKRAYIRPVYCYENLMPSSLLLCRTANSILVDEDIIEHFPPDASGREIKAMAVEYGHADSLDNVLWASNVYVK